MPAPAFDVLDRGTRTELPDGTASAMAYGFGADRAGTLRFKTVSTDANGKHRVVVVVLDRLVLRAQF